MAGEAKNCGKRVLKLVHPRGVVEILMNPITAAEVMRRNPRHLVALPDFFKFPWIVVRPESILNPGSVFYVVPYYTIRCLWHRCNATHHGLPSIVDSKSNIGRFDVRDQEILQHFNTGYAVTSRSELHNFFQGQQNCLNYNYSSSSRAKIDCKVDHLPDSLLFPPSVVDPESKYKKCWEDQWLNIQSENHYKHHDYYSPSQIYSSDSEHDKQFWFGYKLQNLKAGSRQEASSPQAKVCSRDATEHQHHCQNYKPLKSCLKKSSKDSKTSGSRVTFNIPHQHQDEEKPSVDYFFDEFRFILRSP